MCSGWGGGNTRVLPSFLLVRWRVRYTHFLHSITVEGKGSSSLFPQSSSLSWPSLSGSLVDDVAVFHQRVENMVKYVSVSPLNETTPVTFWRPGRLHAQLLRVRMELAVGSCKHPTESPRNQHQLPVKDVYSSPDCQLDQTKQTKNFIWSFSESRLFS